MKPPQLRPESAPAGDIDDRDVFRRLVSDFGWNDEDAPRTEKRWIKLAWVTAFWKEHAPELADLHLRAIDDDDAAAVEYRAHRRCERGRIEYLLNAGMLGGEAFRAAKWLLEVDRREQR
jgi:hypothetical protein